VALDIDQVLKRIRRIIIPALGITQIFAWGSTFYLPAALAPLIASDMGWPYDLTVSGVSVALLVAGLASSRVGRLIADFGGRPVLAIGALLLAAGLLAIGTASNLAWYLVGWLVSACRQVSMTRHSRPSAASTAQAHALPSQR
jgi:predicted MFS family arabinose efflux permease